MWDDDRYYVDKWVCPDCVGETDLQAYIRDNATEQECSYCGKIFDEPACIALKNLAHYIEECLALELSSPEDAGLMWINREGGWQGKVYEIQDILAGWDYPNDYGLEPAIYTDSEELLRDLSESISPQWAVHAWMAFDEEASEIWYFFKKCLQHRVRFMIFHPSIQHTLAESHHCSDGLSMSLEYPFQLLGNAIDTYNMLIELPAGTKFIRVRKSDAEASEKYNCAPEMGPPPSNMALYANRMSPAGIPMFYSAFDCETALKELEKDTRAFTYVAEFTSLQPLRLVDFTLGQMYQPSIYSLEREQRALIRFLRALVKEISAPLKQNCDEKAHIDYIPTQAIAEWLRYGYKSDDQQSAHGVIYQSSQGPGKCAVLFLENEDCIDNTTVTRPWRNPILKFTGFKRVQASCQ